MFVARLRYQTMIDRLLRTIVILFALWHTMYAIAVPNENESEMDSIVHDLDEFVVQANYKGTDTELLHPISNTKLSSLTLESKGIDDIQELSVLVPNLFIPNYGTNMTSTIYMRGLGSRIDQPIMTLYVDDIPITNKNAYDFDLLDLSNITVIRGAQNTLYGHCSMGGAIAITTMPSRTKYTKAQVSYGSANSVKAFVTHNFNHGIQLNIRGKYTDGLYKNTYNNISCDKGYSIAGTVKYMSPGTLPLKTKSITDVAWLSQNGYPYQQIDTTTRELRPIAYNDPCGYRRLTARQGIIFDWKVGNVEFNSITSYNFLGDEMTMDQDFTTKSIFTLVQSQHDHNIIQDLTLKGHKGIWQWLAGINISGHFQRMRALVTFKREGIETLILNNANKGIRQGMPEATLDIIEDKLPIDSYFRQNSVMASAYHNSIFAVGDFWHFNVGFRIEHEQQFFHYKSLADMHYDFSYPPHVELHDILLETQIRGTERQPLTEFTPNVSATFHKNQVTWTASITRGCKSGGFNTQLFSDILQQQLTNNWLKDLGLNGQQNDIKSVISYQPEYTMNYETAFSFDNAKGYNMSLTAFYIDCQNQQLTVFPPGIQAGRMMTNAGRTRSFGAELDLMYTKLFYASKSNHRLTLAATYGYTNARFIRYHNGKQDLKGKYLPYAPQHTLSISADYSILPSVNSVRRIDFHIDWRANGPTYWDDENRYRQKFYGLLNASIGATFYDAANHLYSIKLYGKNLTNEDYSTFYFVSMNNHFLQKGRRTELGIQLTFSL